MTHRRNAIEIEGRVYRRNAELDRFQIALDQLGCLRMTDIPAHSHLEVLGVPMPGEGVDCELWVVNGGAEGSDEFLSVYGGASIAVTPELAPRAAARLRRAFPDMHPFDRRQNPQVSVEEFSGRGLLANVFLNLDFREKSSTTVRDAIEPFLAGFRRLSIPDIRVFICHASEDKPVVRNLAQFILDHGAGVWFDEWEVKVGDSIVQKVNSGIEGASHLVVVLSKHSARKPWVAREFSSVLMRQLNQQSIQILPLRLDDSEPPALLADIKYADCRLDLNSGFQELLAALLVGSAISL